MTTLVIRLAVLPNVLPFLFDYSIIDSTCVNVNKLENVTINDGPCHHEVHSVKSKDGNTVIKDHDDILSLWAEHLNELLNCVNSTDPTLADLIPQFPVIPQLDDPPAIYEIQAVVIGLKNNKAAGPNGIPREVFKYGGHHLCRHLHQFIHRALTTGKLPQQWKETPILLHFSRQR